MNIEDIKFREGRKEDSYRIAELDYIASSGAIEFLFHDLISDLSPIQIVASDFENDNYPHTFRSAIIAEYYDEIIGFSLSFPAKYHSITDEMRNFFPSDRLEHCKQFFSTRVEGSYFLDALCVEKKYRNMGIGNKLIDLTKNKAKNEGFKSLSLLVFADNTQALHVYKNNGFELIKNVELKSHELIPHEGGCLLLEGKTTI
ncbi:GNAT family N-acetyltransferase [bacterium]|nr:GNAT family N-acetyltransferase [bacterium]